MTTQKPYDIVIFGATGFTGQLVVEYFLTETETSLQRTDSIKWAIAGRNQAKIDKLKQHLKTKAGSKVDAGIIDSVPVLIADGNDRESVLSLINSTRVVLSVAGPYALYSALMVELCAENGVHYCDLTGEMTWAQQNVRKFEAAAKKSGARLVHCCGFESVPSDMMAYLLADRVVKQHNSKVSRINYYMTAAAGGASGGTCSSLLTMLDEAEPELLQGMGNPFFYTSPAYIEEKQALVEANTSPNFAVPYDADLKSRSAFFIGAMINQHVVLRSNYLLKDYYGSKFAYVERLGLTNAMNWVLAGITGLVAYLTMYSWTRKLLWMLAPSAGEGPSEAEMRKGFFKSTAFAYDEAGKLAARGEANCVGDPGYLIASKMITEVALCLAKDEHEGALADGGFLTPASACGHSLAKRLNNKKLITFDIQNA